MATNMAFCSAGQVLILHLVSVDACRQKRRKRNFSLHFPSLDLMQREHLVALLCVCVYKAFYCQMLNTTATARMADLN